MTFKEAYDMVLDMNIDDDIRSKAFHSAVLIMYCSSVECWNIKKTHKAAGVIKKNVFTKNEIREILYKLHDADVISYGDKYGYRLNAEFEENNNLQNIVEFTLLALVGAGEVVRSKNSDRGELLSASDVRNASVARQHEPQ